MNKYVQDLLDFISKNFLVILIIGGLVYLQKSGGIVEFFKSLFVGKDSENKDNSSKGLGESFREGNQLDLSVSSELISLNVQEAKVLASRLYDAMKGVGTDEKVVKQVADQIGDNGDNFKAVMNSFGEKPYFMFGMPSHVLADPFGLAKTKNLIQWLDAEGVTKYFDSAIKKAGF